MDLSLRLLTSHSELELQVRITTIDVGQLNRQLLSGYDNLKHVFLSRVI